MSALSVATAECRNHQVTVTPAGVLVERAEMPCSACGERIRVQMPALPKVLASATLAYVLMTPGSGHGPWASRPYAPPTKRRRTRRPLHGAYCPCARCNPPNWVHWAIAGLSLFCLFLAGFVLRGEVAVPTPGVLP